jgi:hypothetical protein
MQDEEYYDTVISFEDMNLVCTLSVMGFSIESIDNRNYPQVGFLFYKTKKLEKAVDEFYKGSVLVEPKMFWAKFREIKSRIKSIKK